MHANKRIKYPHTINTDQGETIVKFIPSKMAKKEHKCLFCEDYTDLLEPHVILLPLMFTGNRRYAHKDHYEYALKNSPKSISLHPSAPNLSPASPTDYTG